MPMVVRITALTLLVCLLPEFVMGVALFELANGDASKSVPFDAESYDVETDEEEDCEDVADLFAALPATVLPSLLESRRVRNGCVRNASSARQLAAPRAPPIVSC